ncbi:MAG TPA: hypothetical protein VK454_02490 [Myxococcaceae bacterium]|nr:hypothetical protein [Myxococcaceae bacterium]
MHTLKVIAAGFVVLGIFLLTARLAGPGTHQAMATAARLFIPAWLVGAAVNMWFGVSRAGYSVADEAPVFLVVFAVPAAVALGLWWWLRSS